MSWNRISVGDLGKVITGNTPPKKNLEYYGKAYKFIKPTDMEIGMRYTPITEEYYSEEGFKKYKSSLIPPLSTCVVTIGSIGKKITLSDDFCFVNQAVNAVVPNEEKYDPFFVFYALKNILSKVKSADTGASSGRENVSKSNFSGLTLEVPENIETQQKIASILSSHDDLIENNIQRIKLLEEAAQNIYEEWFVHFRFPGYEDIEFENGLPKGWEKVNLYEIAYIQMGYSFKGDEFNDSNNGAPVIRIRDIPNQWTNTYSIEEVSDDYLVEKGDILIGMDGFFYINIWCGQQGYLVQRVCRVRSKNENFQGYLLESLRSPINHFEKTITGATVAHLGAKHLKEIFILMPNENFHQALKIFNNINKQKINLHSQNQKLKEARDILLPRLMNRTIEVS